MPRRARPFPNADVAGVFRAYPPAVKTRLMRLRDLIFETASATTDVGEIEETLKWGQPSYLTAQSGSGTTIRIDRAKGADGEVAIYVSCLTDLVETFRERYPKLRYEGKRAIHFARRTTWMSLPFAFALPWRSPTTSASGKRRPEFR